MRFQYFMSFWNWLDQFVLLVSTATLAFNMYTTFHVSRLLKSLLAEPEKFADFSFLMTWSKNFQDVSGLTIFAGFIKFFKYISFNKTMAQLAGTIKQVLYSMYNVHTQGFLHWTRTSPQSLCLFSIVLVRWRCDRLLRHVPNRLCGIRPSWIPAVWTLRKWRYEHYGVQCSIQ